MAVASLGWNGLALQPVLLLAPAICFTIATIYSTIRPERIIADGAFYFGLWLLFPMFGTKLSYIANTSGYPLQDKLFNELDAALGFHWIDWAAIISAHPLLEKAHGFAYQSHIWQPALSISIFAIWGPQTRNRELLTSMLVALLATIAISVFLPAIGPADTHGYTTPSGSVVQALRSGSNPLVYVGIICFPSFHTVMAILFTLAHRDNRWSFPFFLILNLLMLTSIPYSGDHYLTDVLGGIVIAVSAFVATRRLLSSN
jgi:hypothetical protein